MPNEFRKVSIQSCSGYVTHNTAGILVLQTGEKSEIETNIDGDTQRRDRQLKGRTTSANGRRETSVKP